MKGLSAWSAALGHPSMISAGAHGYSIAQGITCIKTLPKIADGPSENVTNPSGKPPGFALERSLLMLPILIEVQELCKNCLLGDAWGSLENVEVAAAGAQFAARSENSEQEKDQR